MPNLSRLPLLAALLVLSGCWVNSPISPRDHKIALTPDPESPGQLMALPPECPSWRVPWGDEFSNENHQRFGCATARNKALTMQNPADLEFPQEPSGADSYVAGGALQRYRSGGVIAPQADSASSGGGN